MSPIKHELLKGMNHVLSYFVSLGNNIVPQYIVATQLIFAEWICGRMNTTMVWAPVIHMASIVSYSHNNP